MPRLCLLTPEKTSVNMMILMLSHAALGVLILVGVHHRYRER
jgi:hypothetical protein